jgi:hypothetical protein
MDAFKLRKREALTDKSSIGQEKFSYVRKKRFLSFIFTRRATLAKTVEQ